MATVTIADMREKDKLLTLDELFTTLETTEPLDTVGVPVSQDVTFSLQPSWTAQAEAAGNDGETLVDATFARGSDTWRLSRDALLEATSICGIPKGYAMRTPSHLIEQHLNYWFRTGFEGKEFQLLHRDDAALALTRGTIVPFSNIQLVDKALEGIASKFGPDAQVLVDKKMTHSLQQTHLRLIVPETERQITNSGLPPAEGDDLWSTGIQIRNSQIGADKTSLDGYLFRYWCTNGQIDTHATSGAWSRRGGQGGEVYEWARTAVDDILGGLEVSLDQVQEMTEIEVPGHAADILRDVFDQYRVPVAQRNVITQSMVDEDTLTMYTLMAAVTRAANETDLSPGHVDLLMRTGGDLVHTAHERCDTCHRIRK